MKTIFINLILALACNFCFSQNNFDTNQINDSLLNLLKNEDAGTAVIITKNNEIIYEKYFGYANIEESQILNQSTKMGIASMSKQFTGMAILSLIEEGYIKNIDYAIEDYLPKYIPNGENISIRQLLSHVSGLPEITQNDNFMSTINQEKSIDQILDLILIENMRHNPGEKYQYCNTAYIILAKLIEKTSGISYEEYLKRHIFEPLRMTNTYCGNTNHENIAMRYIADSSNYILAEEICFSNLIGGGNIISNVCDMAKWNNALLTGNNLPTNYKDLFISTKLNSGESTGYGLGIGHNTYNDIEYYYHPGMGAGMNSINMIFPTENISICVIRNIFPSRQTTNEIAFKICEIIFSNN